MSTLFENIRPGAVISSELIKYLANKMQELEQRVIQLESTAPSAGAVIVTSFEPAIEQNIGQVLVINGSGFDFPPQNNVVTVRSAQSVGQVTSFRAGSTSARLEFVVPPLADISATGGNVTIQVTSSNGSVQRLYRLLPAIPTTTPPPTISAITTASGSPILTLGQPIAITGTNFSTTLAENRVRLAFFITGGQRVEFPAPGSSLTVTAATATRLDVQLPTSIPQFPTAGVVNVTFEVTVGANPPATFDAPLRR